MTDEERIAADQAEDQLERNAAENAAADNFGMDAADNFGADAAASAEDFEDNFGLGDQQLSAGRIPSVPSAAMPKKPVQQPVKPQHVDVEPEAREPETPEAGNFDDIVETGPGPSENIGVSAPGGSGDITISVNGDRAAAAPERKMSRTAELYERFQLIRVPSALCKYAEWFRAYMAENPDALENLEPMLCDEESVETMRLGLKRLGNLPTPEFQPSFFCFPYGMMTEQEREDWRSHRKKYPEYAELAKGDYPYYDPPQFFYRHGAIYLDPAVTDRLAGGVFYQCGAYCGASLIVMSQYKPSMMYGFEPSTRNSVFLGSNVARAGLENVEMYKVCIGDQPGSAVVPDRDKDGNPCKTEVPVASLDHFEEKKNVKGRVAWIQADVGGMSLPVIRGAERMIKRDKPLITVAIYHNPEEFFEIVPLLREWVPEYKFMVRRCQCSPKTVYDKITLIAYIP